MFLALAAMQLMPLPDEPENDRHRGHGFVWITPKP
jgi:hypothetical protein